LNTKGKPQELGKKKEELGKTDIINILIDNTILCQIN